MSRHFSTRHPMATYIWTFTLALFVGFLTGCPDVPSIVDTSIGVVQSGINAIEADSTKWRSVLQETSEKLPKDLQGSIRVEMDQLAQKSISRAGVEMRCNVDFLSQRALKGLRRIKSLLKGEKPSLMPPMFCQVTPATVDFNLAPDRRPSVELSGYDMDVKDQSGQLVKFFLTSDSTSESLPLDPSRIGRTTHYSHVLNVHGPDFESLVRQKKITRLQCMWGEEVKAEVLLIQRVNPPPVSEVVPLGVITHIPRKIGKGDSDFDAKGDWPMHVDVVGESRINGNRIETRAYMHAKEHGDDWTEVGSWSNEVKVGEEQQPGPFGILTKVPKYGEGAWQTAYTAPPGWKIKSVQPLGQCSAHIDIGTHGMIPINKTEGEVVRLFEVWGDRDGDEAGTWTRVVVHFSDVRIEREQISE